MTFRIDSLYVTTPLNGIGHRWAIRMKGLFGHGFYVTLVTNNAGEGLHLDAPKAAEVRWVREIDGVDLPTILVPPAALLLGADDSTALVLAKTAGALLKLGWGPWVDQQGQPIAGDQEELRSLDLAKLELFNVLACPPDQPMPPALRHRTAAGLSPLRKATHVTLPAGLAAEARALGVNLSQAAEAGIAAAVAHCRQERWLAENRAALESANAFVEKHGLPLDQYRTF